MREKRKSKKINERGIGKARTEHNKSKKINEGGIGKARREMENRQKINEGGIGKTIMPPKQHQKRFPLHPAVNYGKHKEQRTTYKKEIAKTTADFCTTGSLLIACTKSIDFKSA